MVSNGQILRGRRNLAGEVGHIVVQPVNGRKWGCGGRGCAESYVSIGGLLKSAHETCRHLLIDGKLFIKGKPVDETTGPMKLARLAREGDVTVQSVFSEMGRYLGIAAANVVLLLGAELIVLSGGLSNAFDLFEKPMKETFRKHCGFKALAEPLRIERSAIKENSAILGAAAAFIHITESNSAVVPTSA